MPEWFFKQVTPGDTHRNSTADAFFDSDTVSDPGFALVREGIQNSLDAHKVAPDTPLLVRLSLVNQDNAPNWSDIGDFFAGVWPHYTTARSGLHANEIPQMAEKCTALVFEDIGTTGLQGDTEEPYEPSEDMRNDFFNFFRAEALTHKSPGDRGSRGVGKATFFQASRVNTLFGLTVRHEDGRRLLMGRTVLRSHALGDNRHHGDGYYGVPSEPHPDFILPIEADDFIQRFAEVFHLERQNETGLSVVVPWPDTEISEDNLIQSVCKNYFHAILKGDLEVWVEIPETKEILNKDNLVDLVRRNNALSELLPVLELAQWATSRNADAEKTTLNQHPATGAYRWSKELFPDGSLDSLREKLQSGNRISLRVQVPVRKRNEPLQESHFDIFIGSTDSDQSAPTLFLRDDILVADIRPPTVRAGIRAFTVIDHEPLAAFLRQAENPSHTQWQNHRVKLDYINSASLIRFVVSSVREIYRLAMAEDMEVDKRLLADFFPIPGTELDRPKRGVSPPSRVSISSIDGGFAVTPGRASLEPGDRIEIRVAYAVRRGNAFNQYRITDFQLDQPPIQCHHEGVTLEDRGENRIVARIANADFRVAVTGFDRNRDIRVTADVIEDADANP